MKEALMETIVELTEQFGLNINPASYLGEDQHINLARLTSDLQEQGIDISSNLLNIYNK